MGLKTEVDDIATVEEGFRSLYTEKDGKHVLTGIEGMVPTSQLAAVKTEAGGYRIKLKEATTKLEAFGDLDPVKTRAELERIPELELAADGKLDDKKLSALVETRLTAKLAPVQRNLDIALAENVTLKASVDNMTKAERSRQIGDEVRSAARKAGVVDSAIEDAIMLGERVLEIDDTGKIVVKDKVGYTPGISTDDLFQELQPKRPHWWGPSHGGGAGGNKGSALSGPNPFTAEAWNMTSQGAMVRADPKKAAAMAAAAGTTVGGVKPAAKK